MDSFYLAAAASIVSLATLIYGVWSGKKKAGVDYVSILETRVSHAEEALERCRKSEEELNGVIKGLQRENVNLMRMIVELREDAK